MARASKTIIQTMQYQPQHAAWFFTTQQLFNQVAAFYFEVITAHEQVLTLTSVASLKRSGAPHACDRGSS